jgi:hypothetical protein
VDLAPAGRARAAPVPGRCPAGGSGGASCTHRLPAPRAIRGVTYLQRDAQRRYPAAHDHGRDCRARRRGRRDGRSSVADRSRWADPDLRWRAHRRRPHRRDDEPSARIARSPRSANAKSGLSRPRASGSRRSYDTTGSSRTWPDLRALLDDGSLALHPAGYAVEDLWSALHAFGRQIEEHKPEVVPAVFERGREVEVVAASARRSTTARRPRDSSLPSSRGRAAQPSPGPSLGSKTRRAPRCARRQLPFAPRASVSPRSSGLMSGRPSITLARGSAMKRFGRPRAPAPRRHDRRRVVPPVAPAPHAPCLCACLSPPRRCGRGAAQRTARSDYEAARRAGAASGASPARTRPRPRRRRLSAPRRTRAGRLWAPARRRRGVGLHGLGVLCGRPWGRVALHLSHRRV